MTAGTTPAPPARAEGGGAAQLRFMTFLMEGLVYALPLQRVGEICPFRPLNRMPHMPKGVEGLLDLRGRVIPVVNLRIRMGLPPREDPGAGTILVLDLPGQAVGLLVDAVDAVVAVSEEDVVPASPILAGLDGAWADGFIVRGEQVVVLLNALLLSGQGGARLHRAESLGVMDLEARLDEDLRRLIELAPPKGSTEHQVIPQIESSISYTEQEMAKVLDRVEAMLAGTDRGFQGLGYLKQEAGMGRLKGHERDIAELERLNQELQDTVFTLIQQIQFQDIARQKLERVMVHLKGMQGAIAGKFRGGK